MDPLTNCRAGLREFDARVEARRPDLYTWFRSNVELTDRDIVRYLVNPARDNFGYGWQDVPNEVYFQALRLQHNRVDYLRRGLRHLIDVPRVAQRQGQVIDEYDGHSQ